MKEKNSLTFSRVIGVFEEIKGGQCRNSTKDKVSKIFKKAIGNPARQISLKYRHRKFEDVSPRRFGWAEATHRQALQCLLRNECEDRYQTVA